jgi:arylsulfatase A-like enzyme
MAHSPVRARGLTMAPLLTALALGFLPGCSEEETLPPNVVLLVLDTVRADHLSSYGYSRPTTPHVDALADAAVRYTQCRATGPWTLPSHASMFTGRFAFQHRADSLLNEQGQWRELPLKVEHTTLAEVLASLGYRTAAFVAKSEAGLIKNETAFAWLDDIDGPFFMFLNYMDAHRPYNTSAIEGGRLGDRPCDGEVPSSQLLDRMYQVVLEDGEEASGQLVQDVTACYDLGIANADLAVGSVIEELRRRELWDNTLLIVTSDHGEFLGEHGLVEHSKDIYEEVLHVPLVCKFPGATTGSINQDLISLADLPRLVATALPDPMAQELGAFFPLPLERDFVIAEISISRERDMRASYGARFRRQRQVFYSAEHKLILSSDGANELYNLKTDPGEQVNIYGDGELSRALTERLESYIRDHPADYQAAEAPIFDAEAMRVLEELGYAGGGDESEQE